MKERSTGVFQLVGQLGKLRAGCLPALAGQAASLPRKEASRTVRRSGQTTLEYALLFAGVIVPLTFGIMFLADALWVWHSMVDFTRDGARYATTHCWYSDSSNVIAYMYANVPVNLEQAQFNQANATAAVTVNYFSVDPDSGELDAFTCASGDCTLGCIPDVVQVSIQNYTFTNFFTNFLLLPGIAMPSWMVSLPMESAGCDGANENDGSPLSASGGCSSTGP